MIQISVLSSGKIVYFKILSEYCYYKDGLKYVTPPNFFSSSYYKTSFFWGGEVSHLKFEVLKKNIFGEKKMKLPLHYQTLTTVHYHPSSWMVVGAYLPPAPHSISYWPGDTARPP